MIASDGYEYETLADRLLGRKAPGDRNVYFKNLQIAYTPEEARGYIQAWDDAIEDGNSFPSWGAPKKIYNHFYHVRHLVRSYGLLAFAHTRTHPQPTI